LKLKSSTDPLPPAITGVFATALIPLPFLVMVTVVTTTLGADTVIEVWINRVTLGTLIGACSGKAISKIRATFAYD
jgi:hypothetical protein